MRNTVAHRLIEEAMLAANVCSADFLLRKACGLVSGARGANTGKRRKFSRLPEGWAGVSLSVSDDPSPSEFQAIAEATKDRPDAQQIHAMLLRSMQQAIYTPINSGHFGPWRMRHTPNFTSPIRRYPDLLVHRVIRLLLKGESYQLPKLPTPVKRRRNCHVGYKLSAMQLRQAARVVGVRMPISWRGKQAGLRNWQRQRTKGR